MCNKNYETASAYILVLAITKGFFICCCCWREQKIDFASALIVLCVLIWKKVSIDYADIMSQSRIRASLLCPSVLWPSLWGKNPLGWINPRASSLSRPVTIDPANISLLFTSGTFIAFPFLVFTEDGAKWYPLKQQSLWNNSKLLAMLAARINDVSSHWLVHHLKFLKGYWMDCREILCRYSQSSDWWSNYISIILS